MNKNNGCCWCCCVTQEWHSGVVLLLLWWEYHITPRIIIATITPAASSLRHTSRVNRDDAATQSRNASKLSQSVTWDVGECYYDLCHNRHHTGIKSHHDQDSCLFLPCWLFVKWKFLVVSFSSGVMLSPRLFLAAIFTWRGSTGQQGTHERRGQLMTNVGWTQGWHISKLDQAWDSESQQQTKIPARG